MDIGDNPFECGFDKYINLESDIVFLGKENLIKIKEEGIKRKLMGVKIDTKEINLVDTTPILNLDNKVIGDLRSAAYSPKFKKVVGIAMINKDFINENKKFIINLNANYVNGVTCNFPIE